MLGALHTVTVTTSDLGRSERLYQEYFGYRTVDRTPVAPDLAASWGAPASAGRPQVVMQPQSGAPAYLRFVEGDPVPDYAPLRSYGWNAIEIIVQDLEALNQRLLDSPFEIIGTPAVLAFDFTDAISAMQVVGPAGEVLYLTHVAEDVPGLNLPQAACFVDRPFIMILGGEDLDQTTGFFSRTFGLTASPPMDGTIRVINRAYNRPPGTKTTICTIALPRQTLIELDALPPQATVRPAHADCLPPAAAIVTFEHDDLDDVPAPFLAPPAPRAEAPYGGRRAATLKGATGELIELIETR